MATAAVKHSITGTMAKGAIAGAAGTWVMGKVTNYLMDLQSEATTRQETQAMIEGKSAPQLTAEQISKQVGIPVSASQVSYATGILPAMFYGVLLDRFGRMGGGRGLLYGTMLFLLMDEIATPIAGLANKPSTYPWQTHARGLAGHLALGVVTYALFKLINR